MDGVGGTRMFVKMFWISCTLQWKWGRKKKPLSGDLFISNCIIPVGQKVLTVTNNKLYGILMLWLNCFSCKAIREDTKWKFCGNFDSAQGLQFTNQYVFSFRFINLLVFFFQVPLLALWLIAPRGCNKERRMTFIIFCLYAGCMAVITEFDYDINADRKY